MSPKTVAAYVSSPNKSSNSRRQRGRHRKPSSIPIRDLRVPAGATLGLMGAVLVPQIAESSTTPAAVDESATTAMRSNVFGSQAGIAPKPSAPAEQAPNAQSKSDEAQPRHREVPSTGKHALRERTPEQRLDRWAVANSHIGIPPRALEAYVEAEQTMRKQRPNCGIPWTMLAGIGRIESNHGQFDGAALTDKGLPSKQIVGIALDGASGVKAITDTDGGKMDNDTVWDRAVGPMQFIPSTWMKWAEDANGDNFKDPHFIDDAALTAANYLCGSGVDLSTEEGQRAALMSYNASSSYGDMALEGAARYGEESAPPPANRASSAGLA